MAADRNPIEWVKSSQRVTALTRQETIYAEGKVIAYCDAPQVLIEAPDGSREWWRADMCREAEAI